MANEVEGAKELVATLGHISQAARQQVLDIVEKNAVRVANHAKEDHTKGFAHAIGRYENQTTNLTNDIRVHGPTQNRGEIEGIVATNKEYAPRVEFGSARTQAYPFMGPALHAIEPQFEADMKGFKLGNAE